MTNTIADLWNGSLEPKGCSKTNYFEIKDLDMLINQNLDKLEKVLDKKSKEVFTSYRDCMEEYAYLYGEQAFCDGFCLGVKLARRRYSPKRNGRDKERHAGAECNTETAGTKEKRLSF